MRAYYQANKSAFQDRQLKRKYGLTRSEFDALYAKQKGRCAICGCKPERPLHVDHDHRTKAVRGLLCGDCNTGIGLLRESLQTLKNALAYLQSHQSPKRKSK